MASHSAAWDPRQAAAAGREKAGTVSRPGLDSTSVSDSDFSFLISEFQHLAWSIHEF